MSTDELRCNNLECRTPLSTKGQAVVTNCSHIFCVSCANDLFAQSASCPACQQELSEPGDIVSTMLHPSNDYKGTVLAGLPPATIMEIAQRALSFWTYQMSQQSAFQNLLLKNTEKAIAHRDQQITMIKGQLGMAQHQTEGLQNELDQAKRRIGQLSAQIKENDKELRQVRGRYDQVKRRALLGSAAHMVENTPEAIAPAPPSTSERPFRPQTVANRALGNQGPQPFVATPVQRPPPRAKSSHHRQPLQPMRDAQLQQQQQGTFRSSSDHSGAQRGKRTVPASNTKLASRRAVGSKEYGG